MATQKIGKFEKNNLGIAVNVLFNSKKGIYTVWISDLNWKYGKQSNLLMVVDGENRHYSNQHFVKAA